MPHPHSDPILDQHLKRVADQLAYRYGDRATAEEVRTAVYEEASHYRESRLSQFIPVLVQHAVQERLRRRLSR